MDAELLRQLLPTFVAEAREYLAELAGAVRQLEQAGSEQERGRAMRIAHGLKGAAGTLGLSDLERTAHALETALERTAGRRLAPDAARTLTRALAAMERSVVGLEGGDSGRISELEALERALLEADGARALLDELEGAIPATLSPDPAAAAAASERLHRLAESLRTHEAVPAEAREPAVALARLTEVMRSATSGDERAVVLGELSGVLVSLRGALQAARGQAAEEDGEAPLAEAPAAGPGATGERRIRVSAERLDALTAHLDALTQGRGQQRVRIARMRELSMELERALRSMGELGGELRALEAQGPEEKLAAAGAAVRRTLRRLTAVADDAQRELESQELLRLQIGEGLRELRTVRARELLASLELGARDVAARLGREVELLVTGHDARIDRRVADALREPLLHLVRNGLDHGLEPAEVRVAAGKRPQGTLRVSVEARGARLAVLVEDDGRGLDSERIREAAVGRGLVTAEGAATLPDEQLHAFLFEPGFTTARAITQVSGRGVGLDAVRLAVRQLGGDLQVKSRLGQGTTFTVDLPQTLGAERCLLVQAGGARVAVPQARVSTVIRLGRGEVETIGGRATVRVADERLPVSGLAALLSLPEGQTDAALRPALVIQSAGGRAVVEVDGLAGEEELVVQSLGRAGASARLWMGAALAADGALLPVVDVAALLSRLGDVQAAPRRRRALVVDDTATTRLAIKALLEADGFSVATAGDGRQALELLQTGAFELMVTDVEMPHLDGLELTRRVRAQDRHRALPIIVVTSLGAPEERRAGMEAGASGYVVKRDVDRGTLLSLVHSLVREGA